RPKRGGAVSPAGLRCGGRATAVAGTSAEGCCAAGLVVVGLADPTPPTVRAALGEPVLKGPRAVQVQFRYAFVCDAEGVKVLDVTDPCRPAAVAAVPLCAANNVYVARTYAYVAAWAAGLVILDVEDP